MRRGQGRPDEARRLLAWSVDALRDMGMADWLSQAEAELALAG